MSAPAICCIPSNEEEKQTVLDQLERLLAHPVFKTSKRCPSFFRYVVAQMLEGQGEQSVKERSIGVEVFGREVGYDTNHDPIVRITAGEVRKRIAQYYHEAGHETEIRIELPPGSYVPQFFFPTIVSAVTPPHVEGAVAGSRRVRIVSGWHSARRWLPGGMVVAGALLAGAAVLLEGMKSGRPRSPTDDFWNPVLSSSAPILLCIGQPPDSTSAEARTQESVDDYVRTTDHIALSDATALADLAGFLGKRGNQYRVQGSTSTSLTDLRQGSAILIAGFDNRWTLRVADSLRYHFVRTSSNPCIYSIQDRQKPTNKWSMNYDMPYSRVGQDFAIVARLFNPSMNETQVIAAGIGENGTIAAGEFISDARFLAQIAARGPRDWARKNLEAVIATQVIDEKTGPPRLVAIYFW
jgi:hypothetical protein